jgi:uncharacterized protein CbrC (UPF0167 family)
MALQGLLDIGAHLRAHKLGRYVEVPGQHREVPHALPKFKYHPDPLATGSVVESDEVCIVCQTARGFVYTGPLYAEDEPDGEICPWCIADGTAASQLEASFTDIDEGSAEGVPEPVLDEIECRTPGFSTWQQDHWMYHCADGCEFLGPIGHDELAKLPVEASAAVVDSVREYGWPEDEVRDFVDSLDSEGDPTAYLFRCLHCGVYQAFSDFS